jgi:hypothetical protein
MLFSPVYTEAHPRQNAAHAASCISPVFSNSFLPRAKGRGAFSLPSYFRSNLSLNTFEISRFRTLASHLKATVFSNSFGFTQLRTLCKIPGIGYPPSSLFLDRHSIPSPRFPALHPISLQLLTKCSSCNSFALTTIHFHGGCIPPCLDPPLSLAEHSRTDCTPLPLLSAGSILKAIQP